MAAGRLAGPEAHAAGQNRRGDCELRSGGSGRRWGRRPGRTVRSSESSKTTAPDPGGAAPPAPSPDPGVLGPLRIVERSAAALRRLSRGTAVGTRCGVEALDGLPEQSKPSRCRSRLLAKRFGTKNRDGVRRRSFDSVVAWMELSMGAVAQMLEEQGSLAARKRCRSGAGVPALARSIAPARQTTSRPQRRRQVGGRIDLMDSRRRMIAVAGGRQPARLSTQYYVAPRSCARPRAGTISTVSCPTLYLVTGASVVRRIAETSVALRRTTGVLRESSRPAAALIHVVDAAPPRSRGAAGGVGLLER